MKKQESKKLTLSRETVRNLEAVELGQVEGGIAVAPGAPGKVSSDNRLCTLSRIC